MPVVKKDKKESHSLKSVLSWRTPSKQVSVCVRERDSHCDSYLQVPFSFACLLVCVNFNISLDNAKPVVSALSAGRGRSRLECFVCDKPSLHSL